MDTHFGARQLLAAMHRVAVGVAFLLAIAAPQVRAQFPLTAPAEYGNIVMTCQGKCPDGVPSNHLNEHVLGVFDVQNWNQPANINSASWNPLAYSHPSWTRQNLGDIFGLCLDAAGNIYVTATVNYNYCDFIGPGGPGAVYKINGSTGAISLFAQLPNSTVAPSGLGNIAFDPSSGFFFVTNFEDGMIYRLDALGNPVPPALDPFGPDGGSAGPAPLGERLWGIEVHNNRLYFSRWNEDVGNNSNSINNEIYSIALSGGVPSGPLTLEVTLPDLPCLAGGLNMYSSPVSDIEFSNGGRMLLAERGNYSHTLVRDHKARVLEYFPTWSTAPPSAGYALKYNVGGHYLQMFYPPCPIVYANSTGGVDYGYERPGLRPEQCDSVVWGTMDWGSGHLTGIPASNGGSNANGVYMNMGTDKNQVGDVETFRPLCGATLLDSCRQKSITITAVDTIGKLCCLTFSMASNVASFFTGVTATVITPNVLLSSVLAPTGWGANSAGNSATFSHSSGYVPIGTAAGFKLCVFAMAPPPQRIVFTWYGKNGSVCRDTVALDCPAKVPPIPACDSLTKVSIICKQVSPSGGNTYEMTFSVVNLNPFSLPAENLDLGVIPSGLTVSPSTFNFAPVPYGGTAGPFTVTISGPGAVTGTNFCLLVKLLGHRDPLDPCCFSWCCPQDTFCFVLPPCEGCCEDFTGSFTALPTPPGPPLLTYNAAGVVTLTTVVSAAPGPWVAASASIASATLSQRCANRNPKGNVFGTITGGTAGFAGLSGPFFAVPPIPVGASHEIQWGMNPLGVAISGTTLSLTMKFPPPPSFFPPPFNCTDTLRFCVRYRFTDKQCRTCDTLVCYQLVRRPKFHIDPRRPDHVPHFGGSAYGGADDPVTGTDAKESHGAMLLAADDPTGEPLEASLTMTSSTDGTLRLAMASVNPDDPASIVQFKMEPSTGINIRSMSDASGSSASIRDHVATIATRIDEGNSGTYTLRYENPRNQRTFVNWLLVRYVFRSNPLDTLEGEIAINARTPAGMGGDTLTRDISVGAEIRNVRTYALQFTADNATGDSIARVIISVGGESKILAVGPGDDSASVVLTPYAADSSGARWLLTVPSELLLTSPVASGRSLGPIYVTVAGGDTSGMPFNYETQNGVGDIVSVGTVRVIPLPLGIRTDNDHQNGIATVALADCRPNPLTSFTIISFTLAATEPYVWLTVSDASGREVLMPINGAGRPAGEHRVEVDATGLASGTYYYTLRTQNATQTRKMVVVR
jgi:hypothetical protein